MKRVHDKHFSSLNQEYKFLVNWVHELSFDRIFVANLTRIGIDIPVVKVIIPEMRPEEEYRSSSILTHARVVEGMFPNLRNSAAAQ